MHATKIRKAFSLENSTFLIQKLDNSNKKKIQLNSAFQLYLVIIFNCKDQTIVIGQTSPC